jgi:hypothetical protein
MLTVESLMKTNVVEICSLQNWESMLWLQDILACGEFTPDIHRHGAVIEKGQKYLERQPSATTPAEAPFQTGGIVVIEGTTGTGKIELAEHAITYCASKLGVLPILGSMGPRIGDEERLGIELLRSTLGVFRHLDISLPADDLQCLGQLLPPDATKWLPYVREALGPQSARENSGQRLLECLLEMVIVLVQRLLMQTSILIVLQLESGSNHFAKTAASFSGFWEAVSKFHPIATQEGPGNGKGVKPAAMMVLAKSVDRNNRSVKAAIRKNWYLKTVGLSEENSIEYVAKYLDVPVQLLPSPLLQYIVKITLGNALYIRETIDQLLQHQHIEVQLSVAGVPEKVDYRQDLESINIASWAQTAMVGETVCLLESLDPLESAVVKMSTVFTGTFTLPDLASCNCSHWAGATMFDLMRLFRATQGLVDRGIIDVLPLDPEFNLPVYVMRNVLIKRVGASMLLETQKKAVKRQALIDRALARDLPERMAAVNLKKKEPHVPWYYEKVLMDNDPRNSFALERRSTTSLP